VTDTDVFNSRY